MSLDSDLTPVKKLQVKYKTIKWEDNVGENLADFGFDDFLKIQGVIHEIKSWYAVRLHYN